jgi:hypothetical protein
LKVPLFKSSRCFLDNYDIPCLVAELKNSDVPGLARTYIKTTGKDPVFDVYLRVKESKKRSTWMQTKLNQLFKQDGLTAAVAEGIKELPDNSFDFMGEDRRDIRAHGFYSYVYIQYVVIDEIRRKVLIGINDTFLFIEHGGLIYLKAGRWHLGDADDYITYAAAFDNHWITKEIDSSSDQQFEREWDALFPPPAKKIPVESDATILCGVWEINEGETLKLVKRLKCQSGEITAQEMMIAHKIGLWFSTEAMEELSAGYTVSKSTIISCERRGNWFALQVRTKGEETISEPIYWCDGKRLIEKRGKSIFTRVADTCRKGPRLSWK